MPKNPAVVGLFSSHFLWYQSTISGPNFWTNTTNFWSAQILIGTFRFDKQKPPLKKPKREFKKINVKESHRKSMKSY